MRMWIAVQNSFLYALPLLLSTKKIFLIYLGISFLFLIYLEWAVVILNDRSVSAVKIYTILHKKSTKTVYYEKSWSILKSAGQIF